MMFHIKEFQEKMVQRDLYEKKQIKRLNYPNVFFAFVSPQGWKRLNFKTSMGCYIKLIPQNDSKEMTYILRLWAEIDLIHKNEDDIIYLSSNIFKEIKKKQLIIGGSDDFKVKLIEKENLRTIPKGIIVPYKLFKSNNENNFGQLIYSSGKAIEEYLKDKIKFIKRGEKIKVPLLNSSTTKIKVFWEEDVNEDDEIEWRILDDKTNMILYMPSLSSIPFLEKSNLLIGNLYSQTNPIGVIDDSYDDFKNIFGIFLDGLIEKKSKCKSLFLSGQQGTGKSKIITSMVFQKGINLFNLNWENINMIANNSTDIKAQKYSISKIFELAEKMSPSIILMDDYELFKNEDREKDKLALLSHFLLGLEKLVRREDCSVLFVAISRESKDLHAEIRNMCEEEFELTVPLPQRRRIIMRSCINNILNSFSTKEFDLEASVEDLNSFSDKFCHGLVGSDLEKICHKAFLIAFDDHKKQKIEEKLVKVKSEHFHHSSKDFKKNRSNSLVVNIKIPDTKWEDIGGLEEIKEELKKVISPSNNLHQLYSKFGITPSNGILLYGKPGTGKSMLCKAAAHHSNSNFIYINISEMINSEIGKSESLLTDVFKKAKIFAPTIIFIDEIQAIFGDRESGSQWDKQLVSQLMTEMDLINTFDSKVVVLAATNCPEAIDNSLLTEGRFSRSIYVPLPDNKAIRSILTQELSKMPCSQTVIDKMDYLISKMHGSCGADIKNFCRKAAFNTIKRNSNQVDLEDFENEFIKEKIFIF